jgi:membrane protein required for colicin V production
MSFAAIDIVFSIFLILAAIRGLFRGFVRELMGMASLILGIVAAVLLSGLLSLYLDDFLGQSVWNQVIAFLAIFIVVYVIVKIFEGALQRLIERIHLERLDKALGFFLGLAEGLVLIFIIFLLLQIQPFFPIDGLLEDSIFASLMLPLFPLASDALQTQLGQRHV